MHRIFCTDMPAPGELYQPGQKEAEHLFKVFRARPGDALLPFYDSIYPL